MLIVSCIQLLRIATCGEEPICLGRLPFSFTAFYLQSIVYRYTGLRREVGDCVDHVWRRDSILDQPFSLDYLPYLRAIAHHEIRVQRKFEDVMGKGGRTTRKRRSCVRQNYLYQCSGGQDNASEGEFSHLAKAYMIE